MNNAKIRSDILKYMETYAKTYCKEASRLLTEKAEEATSKFYNDYTPEYYIRTNDFKDNSYESYYHNNGKRVYGGVRLGSKNMSDYEGASAFEVASLAWNGWHGDPTGYNGHFSPIRTEPPIEIVKDYFYSDEFRQKLKQAATTTANNQKYSVLKIK